MDITTYMINKVSQSVSVSTEVHYCYFGGGCSVLSPLCDECAIVQGGECDVVEDAEAHAAVPLGVMAGRTHQCIRVVHLTDVLDMEGVGGRGERGFRETRVSKYVDQSQQCTTHTHTHMTHSLTWPAAIASMAVSTPPTASRAMSYLSVP